MNAMQIVNSLLVKTIEMCLPWKPLSLYNEQNASILKLKERCGKSAYYVHYESPVDCICCVFTVGIVYKAYYLFIYDKERLMFKSRSKDDETLHIKDLFIEAEKIATTSAWIIKFSEQAERLKRSLEEAQKINSIFQKISNASSFRDVTSSTQMFNKIVDINSVTGNIPDYSAVFQDTKKISDIIEKIKPIIEFKQRIAEQFGPITRAMPQEKMPTLPPAVQQSIANTSKIWIDAE